ncbi:Uncharacterised protein [Mycobacteroides abscessus subsp. abscessus]|nr:Uncharacterised protein [Mycobacteroides abscessus subsp. abscessus]
MRQLVPHALERGLTNELGHEHLFGLIGQFTIGIERRTRLQLGRQNLCQHLDLGSRHRRYRDDVHLRTDKL